MREKINFDKDWLFHLGDVEEVEPMNTGYIVLTSKTEHKRKGPASRLYHAEEDNWSDIQPSENWKLVDLPHDYVIEGTPNKRYDA